MLQLKIVSPEKIIYDNEAESVLVPGSIGQFEILTGHAPIISSLTAGTIEYTTKEGHFSIAVIGGFVEVSQDQVKLCVEC